MRRIECEIFETPLHSRVVAASWNQAKSFENLHNTFRAIRAIQRKSWQVLTLLSLAPPLQRLQLQYVLLRCFLNK